MILGMVEKNKQINLQKKNHINYLKSKLGRQKAKLIIIFQ